MAGGQDERWSGAWTCSYTRSLLSFLPALLGPHITVVALLVCHWGGSSALTLLQRQGF